MSKAIPLDIDKNPDIANFFGKIPPTDARAINLMEGLTPGISMPPQQVSADKIKPPAEPSLEEQVEKVIPKTPQEEYFAALKEIEVTPEEAALIIDTLITKGYYEESIQVTKKLSISFRTRSQGSNSRVDDVLAAIKPEYNATYLNTVSTYNLANSLTRYGATKFTPYADDKSFDVTLDFVKKLPIPLFQALVGHLSKFETKVQLITSSEAIVNF